MKEYRNELGQLHRLDGPAIEYADGSKEWSQNGQFHLVDGPAIEYADGTKAWYYHDQCYRVDGPAIEYANGIKLWYVYGKDITRDVESWLNEQQLSLPLNESSQVIFILKFG